MKTKIFFSISAILVFIILSSLQTKIKVEVKKKPNIIFIAVDDLRPQLNCYGKNQIISPNIDDLASASYTYENARN
tara:strand:+ start:714 stop:941 length:228 start_codon:yes stop_codon:yes gene_type:complete